MNEYGCFTELELLGTSAGEIYIVVYIGGKYILVVRLYEENCLRSHDDLV